MNRKFTVMAVSVAVALVALQATAEDSITDALKNGEAHLDFRLRYEDVDQDNPANLEGDALTLRSRLNYKTGDFKGVTAFLEMDNVSAADKDSYNSTTNGEVDKAVIADPTGTEVNQAWVNYANWDTDFKYGRQRINLDNQRFIGGVSFRQNEQTYDAFSVSNSSLSDTKIFYTKINNVNRIFGEDSPDGDHKSDTDLLNIKYSGMAVGAITGYAYLIDDKDSARFSTDTYGLRFAGNSKGDNLAFDYALEYAKQDDSANNPVDYSADYILAEGGLTVSGFKLKLGYELLGSDDGEAAFITPLATLHKFQGWTDQFLTTPNEGIEDIYLSAGTTFSGLKLLAVYHRFASDEDNASNDNDLGDEWGISVGKEFANYGLSFKYASYSSGDSSFGKSDTEKLWLTATAKF
jgi:hypothetical protein